MKRKSFRRKEVAPADILSALDTIPVKNASTCNWFEDEWTSPITYLRWAKEDLKAGDERGLSNAVCNAKHATCRVIDDLIMRSYLYFCIIENYPRKIKALCEIGISIPDIVYELIIDPRNQLEHEYKIPNPKEAKHAVQLAELFLDRTKIEMEQEPIVALDWNVLFTYVINEKGLTVEFNGFSKHPMLFVDVFTKPVEVKIIHPQDEEISFAKLGKFTEGESVKFAKKLREHYTQTSRGASKSGVSFYKGLKRQGGF